MSAEPTASALTGLLEQLQKLGPRATRADLDALFREPQSPDLEEARRRAALVRLLDREVYDFLMATNTSAGKPALTQVLEAFAGDFAPVPPDGWVMRDSVRDALLEPWQARESEWRTWNTELHGFYAKRTDKASEVEAVYHAAASTNPRALIPYIEARYKAADDRGDFAHCHALLEAIRVQNKFRGSDLSMVYRDRSRYLQTRLMFLEALQKTNTYVKRDAPHRALESVLYRTVPQPWIFHIHATGGFGKTMLLRWFVARDLVLRRVPCATVDFDDPRMLGSLQYPMRLLRAILGQWAQQMTSTALVSAVSVLEQAKDTPGWDEATMTTLRGQLKGANLQDSLVAVLDTLEERTLFQPEWVRSCLQTLRELHEYLPRLTVVLAGRYDLARITSIFETGEVVTQDLPPFSEGEADTYLTERGIVDERMRRAVVDRARVEEPAAGGRVAETAGTPAVFNPFKLAMLADLVLDDATLRPEDVASLPSAEIAYLIERVILRIQSQPLRWVVRYGAIARELTLPFVEQVLLPPLKDALRGDPGDLSTKQANARVQKYLDSKVTWERQPEVADALSAGGLWSELAAYTRERGWISQGDTPDVLHLHPEVIQPVQMLLSGEPVFKTLQAAARDFHLKQWADTHAAVAGAEAIYHSTTIDPADGEKLWDSLRSEAPPESRYSIAVEPTRKSYLVEADKPRYPAWFCRAHVESARVTMHQAGTGFSATSASQATFAAHVAAAVRVDAASVPPLFLTLLSVEDQALQMHQSSNTLPYAPLDSRQKSEALQSALAAATAPYDRMWLAIRAAHYWMAAECFQEAAACWQEAAGVADAAGVSEVTPAHAERSLADVWIRQDRYSDAMAAYDRVRLAGVLPAETMERQARLALEYRDLERAQTLLVKLEELPPTRAIDILRQRQLVAVGDTRGLFERTEYETPGDSDEQRVELSLLRGEGSRLLMDYSQALEMFSRATDLATRVNPELLSTPPGLREVELCAYDIGNLEVARQLLEKINVPATARRNIDRQRAAYVAAFLFASRNDRLAAGFQLSSLERDSRARTRARAMLLDAALNPNAANGRVILELLDAVDPPESLVELFDTLEFLPATLSLPESLYEPVRDRVRRRFRDRAAPAVIVLQMLDLARVCGLSAAAVSDELEAASAALPVSPSVQRLRYCLRLLDHYARLGLTAPFTYADVLSECGPAGAAGSPLEALLKSRTAVELAAAGQLVHARRLGEEALAAWVPQPAGRTQTEVMATQDRIAKRWRETVEAARMEVPRDQPSRTPSSPSPPSPAPPPPDPAVRLRALRNLRSLAIESTTAKHVEESLGGLDLGPLTLRIFNEWRSVQQLMAETIRELAPGTTTGALQISTPKPHACLPWEFGMPILGARLLCRGPAPDRAPIGLTEPGNLPVLLIKPEGGEAFDQRAFSISEEAASGFAMDHLYAEGRTEFVTTLSAPNPDELRAHVQEQRPQVIHIIGQVLDSTAGVYVDLEGSERRVTKGARNTAGARFDASRLIRYIESASLRPVVILDMTAPENITDTIRMLLLRNRLAAELFESGLVRAVLATGLTAPDERESFARALVSGIHQNTSLAFLWNSVRDDDEPQDLGELISHTSSALFAYDPYARVLLPSAGRAMA